MLTAKLFAGRHQAPKRTAWSDERFDEWGMRRNASLRVVARKLLTSMSHVSSSFVWRQGFLTGTQPRDSRTQACSAECRACRAPSTAHRTAVLVEYSLLLCVLSLR